MKTFNLIAWMGGRSVDEIKTYDASDYESSLTLGLLAVFISVPMIFGGQFLFWQHQASQIANWAFLIAASITVCLTVFYSRLQRAAECSKGLRKFVLFTIAIFVMGTNAWFVGHELVLVFFNDKVEAQLREDSNQGVINQRDQLDHLYGLSTIETNEKNVVKALNDARAALERVPEPVNQFRAENQQCRAELSLLSTQKLQTLGTPGYYAVKQQFIRQQKRCQGLEEQIRKAMDEHQQLFQPELDRLNREYATLLNQKTQADAAYNAQFNRDKAVVIQSNLTGVARHQAIWGAVKTGKISAGLCWTLMAFVMLLEGSSFICKFILPVDKLAYERVDKINQQQLDFLMQNLIFKIYQDQAPQILHDQTDEIINELKTHASNTLIPGVRLDLTAQAHEKACERVQRAQQRTGKPNNELLRQVTELIRATQSEYWREREKS